MIKQLFILIWIVTCVKVISQESQYTDEYYLNPFIINPAASGYENYQVLNLSYRKQWAGIHDSPGIQLFSLTNRVGNYDFYNPKMMLNKSNYISKNRVGLGACIFNDNNGPLSYQGLLLSYAYHIPFHFSRLSFGLSASLIQYLLNQSEFEAYEMSDPALTYNMERILFPNTSFGVLFHNHKYFCGVSLNQIFPLRNGFEPFSISQNDYYAIGGYKFNNIGHFDFETSGMVKLEDYKKLSFNIHTKIYFHHFYWFSISYHSYRSISCQICLKLIRNVYVAYGYETSLGEISNYYSGTNFVNLGLNLGLRGVQGVKKFVNK